MHVSPKFERLLDRNSSSSFLHPIRNASIRLLPYFGSKSLKCLTVLVKTSPIFNRVYKSSCFLHDLYSINRISNIFSGSYIAKDIKPFIAAK